MAFSLERLVHAIASSIIQAQNLVEKAQLGNLRSYFNDDNTPISVEVKIPSLSHDINEKVYDAYHVPVVTLVPHGSLVIKNAKIEMDVEIGQLEQEEPPNGAYPNLDDIVKHGKEPIRPRLEIKPESGGLAKKGSGNFAHVTLQLTQAETTEGMARLLNEIIKGQGRVPAKDNKAPGTPDKAT